MAPVIENFENLTYNPFENDCLFKNDDRDPDLNYFNEVNSKNFDCSYFTADEVKTSLCKNSSNESFNILHTNIRSLTRNIDSLKELLNETGNMFNIVCLSESWCTNNEINENSSLHLTDFIPIPFERKIKKRGGGVLIYVKKSIQYKVRNDLSVSDKNTEILTIEIINKETKNILLSCVYKPPTGDNEVLSTFLLRSIEDSKYERKKLFTIGDFNLNCFCYGKNEKITNFYDSLFSQGAFPLITKPTRVAGDSATLIDNIITTEIFDANLKKGIIKHDLSDHFPIFFSLNTSKLKKQEPVKVLRRNFSDQNLKNFKDQLSLLHCQHIDLSKNANVIYETFIQTFAEIYDANFPLREINLNSKSIKSPWISKGLKKSSRTKQKLI